MLASHPLLWSVIILLFHDFYQLLRQCVSAEFELDEMISEWIQTEFEDGAPLHMIGDALSGLRYFEPFTRKRIPRSWRLFGIWRKYEVPSRAPPITPEIALAMAGWCIDQDELIMSA